ncbi:MULTISPECIES: TniB family NTP-binding protein [Pseudomonas]|jgi:hypothetical protein|uniref:TniB family NTP-binding protein n=1 Tax=Pseudomonas TaxID=286 RepID=UPI0005FB7918|nr:MULTISPECIES: TniB family NTP-binding protein [Pseudomonas]KJZ39886.1 hypothetical protein VC33_03925 [Pseudomonas fluorescens]
MDNLDVTHHLHAQIQYLLNRADSERIEYINEDRWINHQACAEVRNRAKSIIILPQIRQASCFMIVGVGGAGKSSLLERIAKDSDTWSQRNEATSTHIELRLSAEPTLANIIRALCEQFGTPPFSHRKDDVPAELQLLLRARGIKIILIDEFNHMFAVNRTEQRKILNFFKNLSGPPLSLNIIAFGTHEALNAISVDTQLKSRFQVFELSHWKPGDELRAFLASYEKFIPLKLPSNLASKEIIQFLSTSLDPTTRNIVNRLKWAAMLAIIEGTERIECDNLDRALYLPDITKAYE